MPRTVWVLAVVGFLIAVGFGVMSPVLPVYVRLFGVSSFLVGLVVSAFAVVRLVSNPVGSALLRVLGPRNVVIAGCCLIAVTTFLMGVSNSYAAILLWRGLSGVGSALYGVGSLALVFAVTPAGFRGRANALVGGGFSLGGMAGPAIGGLVAGYSIHAPFFFYAVTLAAAALLVTVTVPRRASDGGRDDGRDDGARDGEGARDPAGPGVADGGRDPRDPAPSSRTSARATLRHYLRDRRYVACLAVNFAHSWQSYGVRSLLVPLFIVETLGLTTAHTGWAFTAAAIAQFACLAPAGWATDKAGRRPTLVVGLVTLAAVATGLALTRSYAVLVVLLCLYAVGAAATGASVQALLGDAVPATAGPALAAYQMAGDAGLILGPLVAGALIDVLPMAVAWSVGAALLLAATVLVLRPHTPLPS